MGDGTRNCYICQINFENFVALHENGVNSKSEGMGMGNMSIYLLLVHMILVVIRIPQGHDSSWSLEEDRMLIILSIRIL
jgi:hypothetical protein